MLMKRAVGTAIHDQQGFASLVIAVVIVLVLSLTTVGFAQLMQREQRSALDRQLSSQAYYAAESGINDAAKAINAGFILGKNKCGPFTASDIASMQTDTAILSTSKTAASTYLGPQTPTTTNSVGSDAQYTCLTIDPAPLSIQYQSIGTDQPKDTELTGVDPTDSTTTKLIDHITISWQATSGTATFAPLSWQTGTGCASAPCFQTQSTWNGAGVAPVLRIALTPLTSGQTDRANLTNLTYAAFLYPSGGALGTAGGDNITSGQGDSSGRIISGNCNAGNTDAGSTTPLQCNVSITGLNAANYMLDLRSIYSDSAVTIKAYGGVGGNTQLRIKNAQDLIDSTGQSQDVLRRVQVRIPTHNTYYHPDFDVETAGNVCKQLQLIPQSLGYGQNTAGCNP